MSFRYWEEYGLLSIVSKCILDELPKGRNLGYVRITDNGANVLTDQFFRNMCYIGRLDIDGTHRIPSSIRFMGRLSHLEIQGSTDEYPPDIRRLTNLSYMVLNTKRFGAQKYARAYGGRECKRLVNELADFFEEREADKARILHVIWCMRGHNRDNVKDVVAHMTAIMYAKKFTWRK